MKQRIISTRLNLVARPALGSNGPNSCQFETPQATQSCRRGFSVTEVLVSAVLLMTVMSLVGTACHRVNLIWFDVNHHRVAVCELSNHLEELTAMKPEQAIAAVNTLKPSAFCCQALDSPELTGEIFKDDLGSRVVLQITWKRPVAANPVTMSGWIVPAEADSDSDSILKGQQ